MKARQAHACLLCLKNEVKELASNPLPMEPVQLQIEIPAAVFHYLGKPFFEGLYNAIAMAEREAHTDLICEINNQLP